MKLHRRSSLDVIYYGFTDSCEIQYCIIILIVFWPHSIFHLVIGAGEGFAVGVSKG